MLRRTIQLSVAFGIGWTLGRLTAPPSTVEYRMAEKKAQAFQSILQSLVVEFDRRANEHRTSENAPVP